MKIRNGFVSNSSSSSFVIQKNNLTVKQIEMIKNHSEEAKKIGMDYCDDTWDIVETENTIEGFTFMDNFDMCNYLSKIGVSEKHIDMDNDRVSLEGEGLWGI